MSEQIYIRPLRREDALISYAWRNDSEIWRFTGQTPDRLITPEVELAWIDKVLGDLNSKRFAICIQKTDKYIGNVQITDITESDAEFHIFIGNKNYWHKGVATAATKLLIDYVKQNMNIKQLRLWVNLQNIAAVKAYQKNGFVFADSNGNMFLEL